MEEKEKTEKYIFTDTYKTKDLIWEAYAGYTEHYNNHIMFKATYGKTHPEIKAGMVRYANYFYRETKYFYDAFKTELDENKTKQIQDIMEKEVLENGDFDQLIEFFGLFMNVSGIKNITKQIQEKGDAVENGLFDI